ncbi:MAG: AAA family ATPase, partial [Anaerolineae bacterium]|nr:AAA family ATPase [Anaerolineae bacterium]
IRRKVTIAAVYAMQTPVLILDEPTAGLDWRSVEELMERVVELHRRGRTILLISHDMNLVAEYAPRCLLLRAGEVLANGPTREL